MASKKYACMTCEDSGSVTGNGRKVSWRQVQAIKMQSRNGRFWAENVNRMKCPDCGEKKAVTPPEAEKPKRTYKKRSSYWKGD